MLLKFVLGRVCFPDYIPHGFQTSEQPLQKSPVARPSSMKVQFDVVMWMGLRVVSAVVHRTPALLVFLLPAASRRLGLLVFLQLQNAVLEVSLLPRRVLAEGGARRAGAARLVVPAGKLKLLQHHGKGGGRSQVCDDLRRRRRRRKQRLRRNVTVRFLHGVADDCELQLLLQLPHQQAGTWRPGQHVWGASHGAVCVHGQTPSSPDGKRAARLYRLILSGSMTLLQEKDRCAFKNSLMGAA